MAAAPPALKLAQQQEEAKHADDVEANEWPNDGRIPDGNAHAEAAFGRLAVSTVNDREPIRRAGGSFCVDANEERINEGEMESFGERRAGSFFFF